MIALYIIIGILLLLFAVSLLNIRIHFAYNETPFLIIRVAFLKFRILPPKPEKPQKKKPKKAQKPKKNAKKPEKKNKEKSFDFKAYVKQKGISGLLNIVKRVAKLAVGTLRDVFGATTVSKLMLDIKIAGNDAGDSAIKYGKVCTVLFPALKVITDIVTVEDYDVNVNPDFSDEPKNTAKALVDARIRIISIIRIAFKRAFEVLMLYIKAKPRKNKKSKQKER